MPTLLHCYGEKIAVVATNVEQLLLGQIAAVLLQNAHSLPTETLSTIVIMLVSILLGINYIGWILINIVQIGRDFRTVARAAFQTTNHLNRMLAELQPLFG